MKKSAEGPAGRPGAAPSHFAPETMKAMANKLGRAFWIPWPFQAEALGLHRVNRRGYMRRANSPLAVLPSSCAHREYSQVTTCASGLEVWAAPIVTTSSNRHEPTTCQVCWTAAIQKYARASDQLQYGKMMAACRPI